MKTHPVLDDFEPRHTFDAELKSVELKPGDNQLKIPVTPGWVQVWGLEHPTLHVCEVELLQEGMVLDKAEQTFGFRWFAPEDVGTNAVFRLNGKRVVVRTAISWGFWPINGIFPTPELARKQIQDAKDFGKIGR